MSCIPASHSMTTLHSQVESQMDESSGQRRGSRAYQIFPEVNEDSGTLPEGFLYRRERLPSIVVEPTEQSELESGELRWPPRCVNVQEEQDDSCSDNSVGSVDRGRHEDTQMNEGSLPRKSSIGPSLNQPSLSRLSPPASPTTPEAAPPCLKS